MATSNLMWLGKQPEPDQGALQEGQAGGLGRGWRPRRRLEAWAEAGTATVRCGSAPFLGCGIWQVSLDVSSSRFLGWAVLPPWVVKAPCWGLYTLTMVLSLPKWSSLGFLTLEMWLVHFEHLVELCWPVKVSEHRWQLFFFLLKRWL